MLVISSHSTIVRSHLWWDWLQTCQSQTSSYVIYLIMLHLQLKHFNHKNYTGFVKKNQSWQGFNIKHNSQQILLTFSSSHKIKWRCTLHSPDNTCLKGWSLNTNQAVVVMWPHTFTKRVVKDFQCCTILCKMDVWTHRLHIRYHLMWNHWYESQPLWFIVMELMEYTQYHGQYCNFVQLNSPATNNHLCDLNLKIIRGNVKAFV